MPCDTVRKPNQTAQQRAADIRKVVQQVAVGLVRGRYTVTVGPQGAVAFGGLTAAERDVVSDACLYRALVVNGGPLALAKIAQAEQRAGRPINRQALAAGWHTHDGVHWSTH